MSAVDGINIPKDMQVSLQTSNKRDAVLGVSAASETTEAEPTAIDAHPSPLWTRIRACCREAFSEFFGTLILVLFGNGVVAQVVLSNNQKGDYQSISWGWGWVPFFPES
jgi:aquaglyceroporin related protein